MNKLDAAHKLLEAIKHAPLGESVKQQILGAVSLQSLGIFALVFGLGAFAQFTPVGWAADLIIAGLIAFGAYSVGSIIFDVIKDFGAFAQTAVNAKTEDDLKRAGHHFSDAVAKIGVNVVIALIAHSASKGVNARVKSSTTSRNPTSPAAIQTKLDAIKQNPEAVNKPVETTQKPVSSNKPNQSSAKPGQTKAEYKTEQQQARVQGFDPKTRTDAQLAKDIDPKPRPSETPKQAKARVEAAEKEIELRKAMNSSGLTREFISAFKTKEIAQKTAITYNKYGNWAAIKPKIGRPMSQADAKALGYLYASIEGKSKYYLAGEDASKVPQVMENDKGTAFVPSEATYRLANSSLYKKNVEAANAALTGVSDRLIANSQLHHLIGDSVWRGNRFLQKMLAKGIGHMDEGINMIELATTEAELKAARVKYPSVKFSDVLHQGSHDNFDSLSTKILLETIDAAEILLSKDWGDFTPVQMQDVVKKVTHILRNLFINHPDQLPKKSNGTLGSIPTKSETGTA